MAESKPTRKAPAQKSELQPAYIPEIGLYRVKYSGSGAIPKSLEGQFTDASKAQLAINIYSNSKKR